ncbi:MAG: branched-chain amino acid transporter ATP-binding protein [Actinomycetia bacterium]|nr:branched-chain amino acid transporter ATP-binding protein [Actinomycetes bacterium]
MAGGVDRPILVVSDVEVVYADVILALRGVSLEVPEGAIVALLGANGAGKTTLLRAISGLMRVHGGEVRRGSVTFAGQDALRLGPVKTVRAGMAQVMEGRRIFAGLTVDENLRSGAFTRKDKKAVAADYERILELFPRLAERRKSAAGYLSGGEQQMVAIGRALMAAPKLLLLDEPSLGLAPRIVEQIRDIIVAINAGGTSVLLVEQNATMALSIARLGYVLENGAVVKQGTGAELLADADIQEFYLGTGEAGRASFRGLKEQYRAARTGSVS